MKVAPVVNALARRHDEFEHVLIHTGQHYDHAMSQIFFDELGLEAPDEAALCGFALTMPEEVNRILVDALSDLLFVHSPEAVDNLLHQGRPREAIHVVANTMIDTLVAMRRRIMAAYAAAVHGLAPIATCWSRSTVLLSWMAP